MNVSRIASVAALVIAVIAVIVVITGGSAPYTITAEFQDAGQIVNGDEVVIGAAPVGKVASVQLAPSGLAELELQIDSGAAPLRQGTVATIRSNSLVGSANRYVSLGPPAGVTPAIPDHGTIGLDDTGSPVDFDAVLDALDAPTRQGLRLLLEGGASEYAGRTAAAAKTLSLLGPALGGASNVFSELARDRPALNGLISQGALVARALASRQGELASLINHASVTTQAIAGRSAALSQSLTLLPNTLSHATRTFAGLRGTLSDLDRFVKTATPATKQLTPFIAQLRQVLGVAKQPVSELADVISTPGPVNDLTDLLHLLPGLAKQTESVYPRTIRTFNSSQDLLDTLREYLPDLVGAISNLAEASANYDADGHYIRILPILGALAYDASTNTLSLKSGSVDSLSGYANGQGHRCPGGAVQSTPDHSAPVAVAGCDTSTDLPGQ